MISIAIFGSRHQDRHIDALTRLFGALFAAGPDRVELAMEERFYSYVTQLIDLPADQLHIFQRLDFQPSIVLSIGGDGTFLRVAKALNRYSAPIYGINSGHLGFLSAASIEETAELVDTILNGTFRVEERTMVRVSSDHPEFHGVRYALNEVALLRRDTASMINIDARLNGEPLASYRADGLIISTPTGSTGYNLSVGGPVVAPTTPCLIISPVAPHSLNMRPLVVSDRDIIELRSEGRSDTLLINLDGKAAVLPIDAVITVSRAPFRIKVALPPDESFINTLRTKMLWGANHDD